MSQVFQVLTFISKPCPAQAICVTGLRYFMKILTHISEANILAFQYYSSFKCTTNCFESSAICLTHTKNYSSRV